MHPAANRGEKKKKKLGEPAGIMELVFKITKRDKVRISKRCVLINPISKGRGKRRCVVFQVAHPPATWPLALVDFHLTDFPRPVKISMGLVTNVPGELLLLRVSGVANSGELRVEWCRKIVMLRNSDINKIRSKVEVRFAFDVGWSKRNKVKVRIKLRYLFIIFVGKCRIIWIVEVINNRRRNGKINEYIRVLGY